jgi:hypothetical protein
LTSASDKAIATTAALLVAIFLLLFKGFMVGLLPSEAWLSGQAANTAFGAQDQVWPGRSA